MNLRENYKFVLLGLLVPGVLAIRYIKQPIYDFDNEIRQFEGTTVFVKGSVDKTYVSRSQQKVVLKNVAFNTTEIHSSVLLILPRGVSLSRLDNVIAEGTVKLMTNAESFSESPTRSIVRYPDITRIERSQHYLFSAINRLQRHIIIRTRLILPEPHAGLFVGIVFGIPSEFEESFFDSLRRAGLIHIVVASGFNALIVAQIAERIAVIFSKRVQIVIFCILMILYVMVSGAQIPIIRAAIMTGGGVVASFRGEERQSLWWLCISAYLLLLYRPLWLFNVSFQLSFGASFGIIVLKNRLEKMLKVLPRFVRDDYCTTLSAQLVAFPIIYFAFGTASLLSLFTNPLVLWIITPLMYMGISAILLSVISITVAKIAFLPVWILLDFLVFVTKVVAA